MNLSALLANLFKAAAVARLNLVAALLDILQILRGLFLGGIASLDKSLVLLGELSSQDVIKAAKHGIDLLLVDGLLRVQLRGGVHVGATVWLVVRHP